MGLTPLIKLRAFSETDRSKCIDIAKSNIPYYFSKEDFIEFNSWIDNHNCKNLYVLMIENKVIGIGGFYFQNNQARLIYGLIHNNYHKQKYGSLLIEHRIKKIKEINSSIEISLEITEKTYKFFEKFGFKTASITPKFYYGVFDKYEMILN